MAMKSFYKISFIIAGCLIAVGLIFGLVGAAFGGNRQLRDMAKNGELSYGPGEWFIFGGWWDDDDDMYAVSETEDTYPAEGIKKLDINIGAAELNIHPYTGTEYQIIVTQPEKFEYGISDPDTLFIYSKGTGRNERWHKQVDLFVPEKTKFESVVIAVGAGTVSTDYLACGDLEIKVGAGEFTGDKVVAEDMKCDIGAGTMTISDVAIVESDFKIGVGSADISGKISGNTNIKCGMGSVRLDLDGEMEDYNYQVSCAAGNVNIDGETISAISGNRHIDNNSDVTFDIDCAMGAIEIDF